MKKILSCCTIVFVILLQLGAMHTHKINPHISDRNIKVIESIYNQTKKNHPNIPPIIGFIDFDLSSKHKRFWILNIETKQILLNTYVSHGKNSGLLETQSFSNKMNSYKSSLGAFLTGSSYMGKHGLSMVLHGLEKDINHNSEKRHVVLHSAWYSSLSFLKEHGYLGRSWGCPSIPKTHIATVIKLLKDKHLLNQLKSEDQYIETTRYIDKETKTILKYGLSDQSTNSLT